MLRGIQNKEMIPAFSLPIVVLPIGVCSYTQHYFLSDLFEDLSVHKACKSLGNNGSFCVPKLELYD